MDLLLLLGQLRRFKTGCPLKKLYDRRAHSLDNMWSCMWHERWKADPRKTVPETYFAWSVASGFGLGGLEACKIRGCE